MLGQVLNKRYRLDRKIGEGGFAKVYLASDLVLGRNVAVKMLDAHMSEQDDLMRRFELEARAVAALDHSHILTVHDYGLIANTAFLVMPYISGGPLSAKMRAKRLTLEEIGEYLKQLASALDYAHRMGIVHRDVKPQNILIRSDGQLVLTDFGFAKMLAAHEAEAATRALGTVHYIAPEQIRGRVGAASDQYALGVLLYQMVSDLLPFNGTPQDILLAHIKNFPPPLAQQSTMQAIPPEIVDRLDIVIARVLSKTGADRFASCEALYQAYKLAIYNDFHGGIVFEEKTKLTPPQFKPPLPPEPNPGQLAQPANLPPANQPDAAYLAQNDATEIYSSVKRPSSYVSPPTPASAPRQPLLVQPARISIRTEPDQRVNPTFDLNGETLTFGRDLSNNLQLPLSTISRHHATFYRVGPLGPGMKYRLVDNKSRNQLVFRGQPITEKVLEDGDVVEIGRSGYGDYVVYLTYLSPVFQ